MRKKGFALFSRAGLGLDVVMKEGYAGIIGASSPRFNNTPKASLKNYPMTLEPLWACGDCSASPQALRSTVYGKVLTQGSDNNFYVGTDRTANGRNWQIMAATETVSTELQALTGSVRSRAHLERGFIQPTVSCTHGMVLPTPEYKPGANGSFEGLVSARIFKEETPRGLNATAAAEYYCYTLIAVNQQPYPFIATLQIDHLDGLPLTASSLLPADNAGDVGSRQIALSRLFRGSCAASNTASGGTKCDINATLLPNGTALLTDIFDIETTNVYRLGCQMDLLRKLPASDDLCVGGSHTTDCGAPPPKQRLFCDAIL